MEWHTVETNTEIQTFVSREEEVQKHVFLACWGSIDLVHSRSLSHSQMCKVIKIGSLGTVCNQTPPLVDIGQMFMQDKRSSKDISQNEQ